MMTDKEIREYLSSYKLLKLRAEWRYKKIGFFEKYNTAGEYCKILARQAEELLAERRKIEGTINALAEPSSTVCGCGISKGALLKKQRTDYTTLTDGPRDCKPKQ